MSDMMKIYVSGPMTGLEDYNRPAFHRAEKELQALGYHVINPARITEANLGLDRAPRWEDWMRAAIRLLMDADAVALLPDWSNSDGAALEREIAGNLGMQISHLDVWLHEGRAR